MENNFNGKAVRTMVGNFDFEVGAVLTSMVHWSNNGTYSDPDFDGTLWIFECDNVIGHEVDYDRLDDYEDGYDREYDLEIDKYSINKDCREEAEVIVSATDKFQIIDIDRSLEDDEDGGNVVFVKVNRI